MAVRTIVELPNQILTTKAEVITEINDDIRLLAKDLQDTLNYQKNPEGAGIAANQIGVLKRMCVVRQFFKESKHRISTEDIILINPKIISKSKETDLDWEACLSIPDKYGTVQRYEKVKVRALTLNGDEIQINASGFFARVIQHEIDHLDGILFTSKVIGKIITEKELDKILEEEGN